MKNKVKVAVICAGLLFAVFMFSQSKQQAQTQILTAGQKFKNIKVLNDMPAEEMGKVMNIMSASLGVNCNFCHAGYEFEKDGKKEKETAREMLKMTFELNKNYFAGKLEISCNTCHNGQTHPQTVPNLNLIKTEERPKQAEIKPTIEQILSKYEAALGGKTNPAKISSRYIKALRLEPDGTCETEEVWQKSPNKFLVKTAYGDYIVTEAFDGKNVWKRGNGDEILLKPDETEQIMREAELFANANLKAIYPKMELGGVDKINGKEVYLVRATTAGNLREKLYFDAQTGLLVRRIASTQTVLGSFQFQVDYADYKNFGGVKLPVMTRFAVPNISWTRKILEVKINASIDDAKFIK